MAQRRMINKDIILSDNFLTMRCSSQNLYFKLILIADDEGFVSNARLFIKRLSVLDELIEHGYIHRFESGILLINHWNVHNKLRKDTFKPTMHTAEKALVTLGSDQIYYLNPVTEPCENGAETVPQESISKYSPIQSNLTQESVKKASGSACVPETACGASLNRNNFDIFWNMYPKQKDKEATYAAFVRADAPFEEIMAGLENHKKSSQWISDDGMFIPDPANWLYRKEWKVRKGVYKPSAPTGANGGLGEAELAAIRRAIAEGT